MQERRGESGENTRGKDRVKKTEQRRNKNEKKRKETGQEMLGGKKEKKNGFSVSKKSV